jgi:homoserine kinase type II
MAVYTHISAEDLKHYLTLFNIGTLVSFTGISDGVENTNYLLVTSHGKYILTLFEKRVSVEDLPFCLSFMDHLYDRDIPCPRIILDKDEKRIVPFKGKPATIITFLEGRWPKRTENFHAEAVGKTLAHMHLGAREFNMHRDNPMSLPVWRTLIDSCGNKLETLEPGLLAFLKKELNWQQDHWPKNLPAGAIHADLFPDNVFFEEERLSGIIDFYFSCNDIFVYDLMLTMNAWCFDISGHLNPEKSSGLLSAYKKERPLNTQERTSLAFFGRAAAMRIIATRLYDWFHPIPDAMVTPKDPLEYVRILKFYQKEAAPA